MPAVFMTSLTQTDEHKMAALRLKNMSDLHLGDNNVLSETATSDSSKITFQSKNKDDIQYSNKMATHIS